MKRRTVDWYGDRYEIETMGHYLTTRVYVLQNGSRKRVHGYTEALVIEMGRYA